MPPARHADHSADLTLLLPWTLAELTRDAGLRDWLAAGRVSDLSFAGHALARIAPLLGLTQPAGVGALHYRGHTGRTPTGFVAIADPVWLQAGLDKLYVHALPEEELGAGALEELAAVINERLLADDDRELLCLDRRLYLLGAPLATADVRAASINGGQPDDWLPGGAEAAAYHALSGEIQMCLHDLPLNATRAAAGQRPINGLWLWGGGTESPVEPQTLPPLWSDDALLRGYWLSAGQSAQTYPSGPAEIDATSAVIAPARSRDPAALLAWCRARRQRLCLLLADDVRIDLQRGWRRLLRRRSKRVMAAGGASA